MITAALLALAAAAGAVASPAPDPLVATSTIDPASASPLRQVTIVTGDPELARRFFRDAMAMRADVARPNASGTEIVFHRTGGTASVRVITPKSPRAPLRPTHAALAPGGLAMGMPVADQRAGEARVTAAGFTSVVGATTMTLPRGDGTSYTVGEIHYRAPDGVLVLGIDRGAMRPVGPIDPVTGIGGPAYASIVVNDLDGSERFMRDVLRYEKRRDAVFASAGPKGGLGLPDGQRFAFQQWFAPGASTGYIILMKMLDRAPVAAAGGLANAGLVMVGFDATDVRAVAARARTAGARIVANPKSRGRPLTLAMPDGFLVEITQRRRVPR